MAETTTFDPFAFGLGEPPPSQKTSTAKPKPKRKPKPPTQPASLPKPNKAVAVQTVVNRVTELTEDDAPKPPEGDDTGVTEQVAAALGEPTSPSKREETQALPGMDYGDPKVPLLGIAFGVRDTGKLGAQDDFLDPEGRELRRQEAARKTATKISKETGKYWGSTPEGKKAMADALQSVDDSEEKRRMKGQGVEFFTGEDALSRGVLKRAGGITEDKRKAANEKLRKEKAALTVGEFTGKGKDRKRAVDPKTGKLTVLTIDEKKEALKQFKEYVRKGAPGYKGFPTDYDPGILDILGILDSPYEDFLMANYRKLPEDKRLEYGILKPRDASELPRKFKMDFEEDMGRQKLRYSDKHKEVINKMEAEIKKDEDRLRAINNALFITG